MRAAQIHEHIGITKIATLFEVRAEQRLADIVLTSLNSSECQQRMGGSAVGHPANQVESELDAERCTSRAQLLVHFLQSSGITKLAHEVLVSIHPIGRELRIQFECAPAYFDVQMRTLLARQLEAALANEAPWTDGVGIDLDLHGSGIVKEP